MQDERKRILQLVENGVISAEEAIVLLEKLSTKKESTSQTSMPTVSQTKEQTEEAHTAEPNDEKEKNIRVRGERGQC